MRRALLVLPALLALLTACSSATGGTGTESFTPSAPSRPVSTSAPLSSPAPAPATSASTASTSPPSAASSSAPTGAVETVVRPVTAAGAVVAGWNVKSHTGPNDAVTCAPAEPSPVAVDPGIAFCAPSAAYAIACWRGADGAHALCLLDPAARTLSQFPLNGSFPSVAAPKLPAPFQLTLSDGARCSIRDGGTGENLTNHPDWVSFYYCSDNTAIYGPPTGSGIDTSTPTWSVHVGPQDGEGDVVTRAVTAAVFVGSAGS